MTNPTGTAKPAGQPDENASELAARAALEVEFGALQRVVAPGDVPVVDYRTPTGDKAFEIKQITDENFRAMGAAFRQADALVEDVRLAGHWVVMIPRPNLAALLPWEDDHPQPQLMRMATQLVDHLVVLEQFGISQRKTPLPEPGMDARLAAALTAIDRRTGGAPYHRAPPSPGPPGQVLIYLATGSVQTGQANTLVGHLDRWLASSPQAIKLRRKLAREPAGTERHAFVVFDALTEPEVHSAREQGVAFCPTEPPALPAEVDVLWALVGPVVWRYDPDTGWTTQLAPPAAT